MNEKVGGTESNDGRERNIAIVRGKERENVRTTKNFREDKRELKE